MQTAGFNCETGVFMNEPGGSQSKNQLAFPLPGRHNGTGRLTEAQTMANDDTRVKVCAGGVLPDDVSAPQSASDQMAKAKLDLRSLSANETVALVETIKTAMTGNASFPNPNPDLTTFGAGIAAASAKIAAYNSIIAAAQVALVEREEAVKALRALLRQMAAHVENVSGGDAARIESAGMSVRAAAASVGPLSQVPDLVLTAGDKEGTLDAAWDPVRGVKSYEVQFSPDPPTSSSWAFKLSAGKSSATLERLTSGARIWVRCGPSVRGIALVPGATPLSRPCRETKISSDQ